MARSEGAKGNAKGKKQTKPAGTAVVKTKVSPAVRFTDMKANAGMRFSVAGAKMSERMTHIRANLMLKLYRLQHPSHPVKRVAATETIKELKAAATERRRQRWLVPRTMQPGNAQWHVSVAPMTWPNTHKHTGFTIYEASESTLCSGCLSLTHIVPALSVPGPGFESKR